MKIFGLEIKRSKTTPTAAIEQPTPTASTTVNLMGGYGNQARVYPWMFDGEKDLGGMGPIKKYTLDYFSLRLRSYQLFLESDVCQALFNRSAMWGVGSGLKLQASPEMEVLEMYGVEIDKEDWNEYVESLFKVYSSSKICDYSGNRPLSEIATEAWTNSEIGGDILLVMRVVNNMPKVQIIDASHVRTPQLWGMNNVGDTVNPTTKNRVRNGVEIDDTGHHVAYWVCKTGMYDGLENYERIPCYMDKYPYSQVASLIYGMKYRLDNVRGMPLISAVMETASKMGRYREATLAGAESRAKIAYTIEHEKESTGENPLIPQMSAASGFGPQTDLPMDSLGENLANRISTTTENMAYNMPIGAKLAMHESKQETLFSDFYTVNWDITCAVAGYPPEVIMSKYNSNYSSSRAAIKDFEHTLKVKRQRFASQFYQIIYNFCLDFWVLSGTIKNEDYLMALARRNEMVLTAFRSARWAGDAVPHIDPYKEVQAIRAMLPEDAANQPLCTLEQAVEALDNGDYQDVLEQYAQERDRAKEKGVEPVAPKVPMQTQPNGNPKNNQEE